MPDRWASDPSFPVVFDIEMNEYAVVHAPNQQTQAIMRYCFWCGGALPDSKRGMFFMEPDRAGDFWKDGQGAVRASRPPELGIQGNRLPPS